MLNIELLFLIVKLTLITIPSADLEGTATAEFSLLITIYNSYSSIITSLLSYFQTSDIAAPEMLLATVESPADPVFLPVAELLPLPLIARGLKTII